MQYFLLAVLLGLVLAVSSSVVYRRALDDVTEMIMEGYDGPLESSDLLEGGLTARRGSATKTHSCSHIRRLPSNLRNPSEMYPNGLTNFYQKYTEAYGIPVVSSGRVPDDALKRACYVLRFLLADHSGVRNNFYRRYGRVGIIGAREQTTDIPEHSYLDPTFWNARARGLGATEQWPISTGAEENILCYGREGSDRYPSQDICLHEYAHGVHNLGAKYAISGWDSSLSYWYNQRKAQGLWARTYSMSTYLEYFAEGVQSWFYVNREANPPDGINNHVNTREELRSYDYELYKLVSQVFPCKNTFIKRCEKNRAKEQAQVLRMDCNESGGGDDDDDNEEDENDRSDDEDDDSCRDLNEYCASWQSSGYCTGTHQEYMSVNCRKSCQLCGDTGPTPSCQDGDTNCAYWAGSGYCSSSDYQEWMEQNCMKSCNTCPEEEEEVEEEEEEEVEEEDAEDDDLPPVHCYDRDPQKCRKKARKGQCTTKVSYMRKNCKKSCDLC